MSIAMPSVSKPESAGHAPQPGVTGRLRQEGLAENDLNYCLWMHLAVPIGFLVLGPLVVVTPLVMWLVRRDQSAYVDDHGREVLNLMITGLIVTFVLMWLPIIGWLAILVWYIAAFIGTIRGSIAARAGEYFRYPMTIRFLS